MIIVITAAIIRGFGFRFWLVWKIACNNYVWYMIERTNRYKIVTITSQVRASMKIPVSIEFI